MRAAADMIHINGKKIASENRFPFAGKCARATRWNFFCVRGARTKVPK